MRPLTVREAALILGLPIARVRVLCELGEIPATLSGEDWTITDQRIEQFGRLDDLQATTETEPDFTKALNQIEHFDILTDCWIPDILRHEDKLADRANLLTNASNRFASGIVDPAFEIEIPKTPFFARTGHLLTLEDRITYHAMVASFAAQVESRTPGVAFSTRLAPLGARTLTKKGVQQWRKWGQYVRSTVKAGNPWLIKSDLTAYFDCIRHDILLTDLRAIGVSEHITARLGSFLSSWAALAGQGLPQGPDVSRILGNFYMIPVDQAMLGKGYKYSRYMDDIRIAGRTKTEVVEAMRVFGAECRQRGLFASTSKTSLLFGKDAEHVDLDNNMASAANLMENGKYQQARKTLTQILEVSLLEDGHISTRQAKFSLWRLAQLREEEVCLLVLDRLDDLAPVASVAADYLTGFISRDYVQARINEYLADPDNIRHSFLMTFIFAAMLEKNGLLPTEWIDYARRSAHDRNLPKYLRVVASNVVALGGILSDLTWLRRQAIQETDPELQRGYATALRRAGRLDETTAAVLESRSSELRQTVQYLQVTETLPSLVRCYSRIQIRKVLQ